MKVLDWLTVLFLKRLKPGYLPEPIFNEMQRINHCVSVEILVKKDNKVLLQQRDSNDKFWANEWHIPGTMVRGDESYNSAIERLLSTVLDVPYGNKNGVRLYLNKIYSYKTKRGYITHILYAVDWSGETVGTFFDIKKLPKNIMEHHKLYLKGRL